MIDTTIADWPTLPEDNAEAYKHGYYEGLREGVTLYAWWKDGVQMVGTGGRTLRRALAEIDQQEREARTNARTAKV